MLRGAVDDLPLWLLLVVFVAAVVGLVLLLVWLIRRLVPAVGEGFDAEVASQMLGVVAALFGLLLAFIIVIAYQNYSDAQSNVTGEADALAAIVRDTGAFSQPERNESAPPSACTCEPSSTTSGRCCAKARTQPPSFGGRRRRSSAALQAVNPDVAVRRGPSTTTPCAN